MNQTLKKGEATEEILREYFLKLGYFVVRSIPYKYNQFDVTDVDIWLYSRPSPLTRERTNVDIKRKKTPQALERIFWAKGLQQVLSLERCVVATTDTRPDVREFGLGNDVIVLDGNFLKRLVKNHPDKNSRLNEEELIDLIEHDSFGKFGGDWKSKFFASKSNLLNKLNFDGCNEWLLDIKYFMEQSIVSANQSSGALRLLYITTSFFLIGFDYVAGSSVFLDSDVRFKILTEGFRYGQKGETTSDAITNVATKFLKAVVPDAATQSLRAELSKQFNEIPVQIIVEFFQKPKNMQELINIAKNFEAFGYAKEFTFPKDLPSHLQGMLGLLCDFNSIDRKKILSL
ncbi:MAG: hypothetical protein ABFS56_30785 [Pseudomonadota bacterium]